MRFTTAASPSPDDEEPKQVSTPLHVTGDKGVSAVALQVRRDATAAAWLIDISANGQAARQPLGMTVMHEGRVERFEEMDFAALSTAHATFSVPEADMRTGVNQVTVFDTLGHVLADRLFFVQRTPLAAPQLTIGGMKQQYEPYEAVELAVSRECDEAVRDTMPAVISLAVRDAAQADGTFDSGNIMTEMLLASEIKGFVPHPEYFFEADDAEHRRALDLLMLTQGWRRFSWHDMAVQGAWELTHPAEHTQIVSGTVNQYYAHIEGFNPNLDTAMAEHETFMRTIDTPLSEQDSPHYSDPQNVGGGGGTIASDDVATTIGNRSYGWNINPDAQRDNSFSTQQSSRLSSYQPLTSQWSNNDYNIMSYRAGDDYRAGKKHQANSTFRRYLEEGSVSKEVRVHAEFADMFNPKDYLEGDVETLRGRFQLDLPRFNGQCVFFLAASDTTKWKRGKQHVWVNVDPTNEYSQDPTYPEYYVRLNWAYPRWVKPYTYYQVKAPSLTAHKSANDNMLTSKAGDVFSKAVEQQQAYTPGSKLETTLDEVTVHARHNGIRRIDYSKPAYVIDALEALNICMDAGLIDYTFSAYDVSRGLARALVSDMGMERHYNVKIIEESEPGKFRGPLEQRRFQLLTFIDKLYVYTDYSPRREGDERYAQDNQPEVCVDIRRMPNDGQRVTYIDRRIILDGFAYEEDFYNPDYQRTPPTEATADYRRTLYWNPDLRLDSEGRANIRFFTGTRPTSLSVDAQGQDARGALLFNK